MRRYLGLILALALLGLAPRMAEAQNPSTLEVIVFPGGFNWPIWVAQEKGFFAKNDVTVHLTPTPGSIYQLTNLVDGKFDIGVTAIDNLIAYDEGQGEGKTKAKPNLVAVMGGDNGFLHLVTLPEIKTYQDLKGKELSVDALTTGFAFVLEKILQKGGLTPDDYKLVKAGGVLQRFEALMEKKHAGTLLITPFEIVAESKGYNDLASAIDVFGHYQGLVAAVRRPWAKSHRKQLIGYIRGYVAGVDWLYEPQNKAEAIAILRKNLPNMSEDLAEKAYAVLLDPEHGFEKKGQIDIEGVKTVLVLRSEYGEPRKKLTNAMRYYDPSYYKAALGSR